MPTGTNGTSSPDCPARPSAAVGARRRRPPDPGRPPAPAGLSPVPAARAGRQSCRTNADMEDGMTTIAGTLGLDSRRTEQLLETAGRAPSLHNTQPWWFRIRPDTIELHSDPERRLPVTDPDGREQRMACGAALYNLRLA